MCGMLTLWTMKHTPPKTHLKVNKSYTKIH
nr:MAG TPA: hypothetical protein [Caudoviricetes sp.]